MTDQPTDHAARAEYLLADVHRWNDGYNADQALAAATVHALLAVAEAANDIAGAIHLTDRD